MITTTTTVSLPSSHRMSLAVAARRTGLADGARTLGLLLGTQETSVELDSFYGERVDVFFGDVAVLEFGTL